VQKEKLSPVRRGGVLVAFDSVVSMRISLSLMVILELFMKI